MKETDQNNSTKALEPRPSAVATNGRLSAKDIVIRKSSAANDPAGEAAPTQDSLVETEPAFGNPLAASVAPDATPTEGDASTGVTVEEESADAGETNTSLAIAVRPILTGSERFPYSLLRNLDVVQSKTGRAYLRISVNGNDFCLPVGSKAADQLLRQAALVQGFVLRKRDLAEINDMLCAHAEALSEHLDVWYRVAKLPDGIEIDLGDDAHTRVRISPDGVIVMKAGSQTLFFRTGSTRAFAQLADQGDLSRLNKYVNVTPMEQLLFLAWLTYTLAHPKAPGTAYVFLVVKGDQGSGKSFLTRIILSLVDPSRVGIRMLPRNSRDLGITLSQTHVAAFDNVRGFSTDIADTLCVTATGGAIPSRKLYSDDTEHVQHVHGAVVLNGIHAFISQPDLAQRCLTVLLKPLPTGARRSEAELIAEFDADLPYILRGAFELIASIFRQLPAVENTNSERMLDFVTWLGAMERVDNVPPGTYQAAYSHVLHEAELDTLLDHPLAAAIFDFARSLSGGEWSGTPTELYERLCFFVPDSTQRSKYWPSSSIAMSKRLTQLIAGLRDQGVVITVGRSKQRHITIKVTEEFDRG